MIKFEYEGSRGKEYVHVDLGASHQEAYIGIVNSLGDETRIYCRDVPAMMSQLDLAMDYAKYAKKEITK